MASRFDFRRALSICLLGWTSIGSASAEIPAAFPENPLGWPAVAAQNKPWTRWWWLGSAVDKANLTRELEEFAKAGIGGVEICPIYGAMGAEDRFIDYLSPKWMEMLAHTTREAKRLGLGVDMTTGTGWPFGGPMVNQESASEGMRRLQANAVGGRKLTLSWKDFDLVCLRAFPASGSPLDLKDLAKGDSLEWTPPEGTWVVSGIAAKRGIQQVKRAAPGGSGLVLDPYSPLAMRSYTAAFDKAFTGLDAPLPRAQFHDSFEYYGADWTPDFINAFQKARGYDLRSQLPAFNGMGDADVIARVRADYRQTLGELHHGYLSAWHDWAASRGEITRNQAHGSPGNLLDHYAVADIPETEIFKHVAEDQIPMLRFATSAANAMGRPLVSSETFTWLGEHFQVAPAQLKEAADFVFLGGVNHLFFHGIPYSPGDMPWPGWLFYASTHMGPNGGLWHDLPAFTGYIQRCQSILQSGTPDSDVLLYFPFADLIHDGAEKLPLLTVHNQNEWLHPTPFYQAAMEMWNKGVTFDFVSDDLLKRASVRNGGIMLGNNSFKVLVLPGVKHIEPATLERLADLAAQGGKILVQGELPNDVPGFTDLEKRRNSLRLLDLTGARKLQPVRGPLIEELARFGVARETMTDRGLRFVRRKSPDGYHYFIVNRNDRAYDAPLALARSHEERVSLDPWNPDQIPDAGQWLHLAPGESIIVRTFNRAPPGLIRRHSRSAFQSVDSVSISGPWKVEFLEGGPELPKPAEVSNLASWTTLPDPAVKSFSGTARYTTRFKCDVTQGDSISLDLGKVAHTARVFIDEKPIGISWCPPHELILTGKLVSGDHSLAIEVTNLAANRIADLDRKQVPWKRFHEINFVNIDYKPFDASGWPPLDSGLLGPVRILIHKP